MEIVGIGTDIVEIVRIAQMIEKHGETFLARVYTDLEIRYCREKKNSGEHFAARWAGKEAVLKCLGTGWAKGIAWTDVEIRNEFSGAPRVSLSGEAGERARELGIADVWITLSHSRAYATATAIAVTTPRRPRDAE